ncbi:uncharacterized protein LOC117319740 [Pecten maximus]|uniref:uncharacterized protein LOC117319740 n=1 Tax=Pecten maximus TaxID=6579 RepID=UPI001458C941|nr:uncharacterized protein LOC117319740 [Pecten maximus]
MVLPTTLKKRHTLKGRNVLPAIRRLQEGAPVKALARMMAGRKTEDLSMRDVEKYVNELTDESLSDQLELAGKNKEDISEARLLLHYLIVLANEKGQPQGQDLLEAPGTSTEAQGDITQENALVRNNDEPPNKRSKSWSGSLEARIAFLESSTSPKVSDIKERVRILCLQPEPSNSLILLTLEELAKAARSANHEESGLYEELLRQVHRLQSKVCLPKLCLSVLGGNESEKISKAIAKCMKDVIDTAKESKKEAPLVGKTQTTLSPLDNLYVTLPLPGADLAPMPFPLQQHPNPMYGSYRGYVQQGYGQQGYGQGYGQGYRNYRRGGFRHPGQRPRGACLVCDSTAHQVRDCPKVKEFRQK